jgi:tetratricopeptide (TPR) repeat protein
MMRRAVFLLACFAVPCIYAQSAVDAFTRPGSIKVRVTSKGSGTCALRASVSLVSASGAHIAEDLTNGDCEVYFVNLAAGGYHVVVSGSGIETSNSGRLDLDSRGRQDLDVRVKYVSQASQRGATGMAHPLVAAVDLNIPASARKEFDKANQFVARGNWQKAVERLNKAIAIYPHYAEAYNNLGVVYGRLGSRVQNLEALQKAVSLNDHFAPAYLNLARVAIADRDFAQAEALLTRATSIDPTDSQILSLLAHVEFLNHHYDQALSDCRRAHSATRGEHAVVHYVAARIFEEENRPTDALAELQTFLSEEQSGPRADAVRREIVTLQQRPGATEVAR